MGCSRNDSSTENPSAGAKGTTYRGHGEETTETNDSLARKNPHTLRECGHGALLCIVGT